MPSKNRIPATMQMVKGQDDDLIDWYLALPDRTRNQALKSVLRMALFGDIPEPSQEQKQLFDERLAQLEMEYRQKMALVDQAIEQLMNRVEGIQFQAANGEFIQPEPQIEMVSRLSSERKEQRAEKLKKAKW